MLPKRDNDLTGHWCSYYFYVSIVEKRFFEDD